MARRWLRWSGLAALALALALVAAACGGDDNGGSADTSGGTSGSEDINAVIEQLGGPVEFGTPAAGGTYRIANTDFANSDGFDPTGEYFGSAWGIYSDLMLRTLLSYNHVAGNPGNEVVPDIATDTGQVSDDGLTYTFTLKDGIKFGPPVNRAITSKDIAYSFQRLATPSVAAQYPFYYSPIEGFDDVLAGKAKTISGITTPDDSTIVFKLTEKTGDFPFRLAMPATSPIPEEVAKCHTAAGEYGRYIITTGPYMIDGSDKLDISNCGAQKPISGFNPNTGLNLVRNPNYDPATDSPESRSALPDRFEISVNTNLDNIFDKIERGELEGSFETPPNAVLRRYLTSTDIREKMRINAGDRVWYAYMNLTTPPFDDIHVRKAMNLVMDLEGIQRAWGGPVVGRPGNSVLPRSLVGGATDDYDPYQQGAGDVEAAKAEMKQSKYDTNQDGMCDAGPCKGVINLNRNFAPWSSMSPIIEQSASKIGVSIQTREAPRTAVSTTSQTPSKKTPFSSGNGWGKDFADPITYFGPLFLSSSILQTGNQNFSLVGLTAQKAKQIGVDYPAGGVPSVDADIAKCTPLTGQERTDCWVALDKKVTETIAPWVPLIDATAIDLIGPAVTKYEFDQFSTEMSMAHVAVDPALQK